MSDFFSKLDSEKMKKILTDGSVNSLDYITKGYNVVLKIQLTCQCLKSWYDFKNTEPLQISYCKILNAVLASKWGIKVKESCTRVEGRLRRLCSETRCKLKGKSGNAYVNFCKKTREIEIQRDELVDINEVIKENDSLLNENEFLKESNQALEERCEKLFKQLQEAHTNEERCKDMLSNMEECVEELDKLKEQNNDLHNYIEKISGYCNKGGKINEVKERQKRRKVKELKSSIEQGLWFARTFGLNLHTTSFTDESGNFYSLDHQAPPEKKLAYKDLSEEEQDKVKSVLFVTDKFCISNAAYHELTMLEEGNGLPRSYLVKQCKEKLNQLCHVSRTPGKADGAQLNVVDELTNRITAHLVLKTILLLFIIIVVIVRVHL